MIYIYISYYILGGTDYKLQHVEFSLTGIVLGELFSQEKIDI